jgi:hypothetical protein
LSQNRKPSAHQILKEAKIRMGIGWDTVRTLKLEGYGNSVLLEQSERAEGPYIPIQFQRVLTIDVKNENLRSDDKARNTFWTSGFRTLVNGNATAYITGGGRVIPSSNEELQSILLTSPQFLLKKASESADMTLGTDTMMQKQLNYSLKFIHNKFPITIYINKETMMLTAVEVIKPYYGDFGWIWGDAKQLTIYSFWNFLGKKIHYPLQTDFYLNGHHKQSFLVTKWGVNTYNYLDSLVIPDSSRIPYDVQQINKMNGYNNNISKQKKEIFKDLWIITGPCNSTIVKQDDGIVVVESPQSSTYGEALLKEVKQLFPNTPIKALVATSDAWLHLGGIRAFAANKIPIYYVQENNDIVKNILAATYITYPDALQMSGVKKFNLKGVRQITTIGKGNNQLELIPFNTETGDRMMMVYFPNQKLLYCSDLYQPKDKDGTYWQPHYVWEVLNAIEINKLPADIKLYAMHVPEPIPLQSLKDYFK